MFTRDYKLQCTFFFFNDRAPPEIYTLSLHDALPILADPRLCPGLPRPTEGRAGAGAGPVRLRDPAGEGAERSSAVSTTVKTGRGRTGSTASTRSGADRKSTRLNSSHT